MSEPIKASRATIRLGSLSVDGFMLPDGSYRMSLTQAAECVGKAARSTFDFLQSKALKRLLEEAGGTFDFLPTDTTDALKGNSYTPDLFVVDIGEGGTEGQTRIRGLSLELVSLYWAWESFRGNRAALVLIVALAVESLERRFDAAFGIARTEGERNENLATRIQRLERELKMLGDAYAIEDDIRMQRDYFERLLREHGIDPWEIPGTES